MPLSAGRDRSRAGTLGSVSLLQTQSPPESPRSSVDVGSDGRESLLRNGGTPSTMQRLDSVNSTGRASTRERLADMRPVVENLRRKKKEGLWDKLSFIEKKPAKTVIGLIIVANLLCTGLEIDAWPSVDASSDHTAASDPAFWMYLETIFVLVYTIEQVLLFMHLGWGLFLKVQKDQNVAEDPRRKSGQLPADVNLAKKDSDSCVAWLQSKCPSFCSRVDHGKAWMNLLDVILVLLGLLEVQLFMFGRRSIKLIGLRLLRFVRIFRMFSVLQKFVEGLIGLLPHLVWIFSIIGLTIYVWAVFIKLYTSAVVHEDERVRENFSDLWTVMFSLFQVTTMDGWDDIATPLIKANPVWRIFFVAFISFCAWTMISLLTAVVSDNMIQATQLRKDSEQQMEENNRLRFISFLEECFLRADTDGNGKLDREEFAELIKEDQIAVKMEELGVAIPREELKRAFDMLDVDESGTLTIEEFTMGLGQLQQSLSTKHVLSIDYALQRVQVKLSTKIDTMTQSIEASEQAHMRMKDALERLCSNVDELRKEMLGGGGGGISDVRGAFGTEDGGPSIGHGFGQEQPTSPNGRLGRLPAPKRRASQTNGTASGIGAVT